MWEMLDEFRLGVQVRDLQLPHVTYHATEERLRSARVALSVISEGFDDLKYLKNPSALSCRVLRRRFVREITIDKEVNKSKRMEVFDL